MKEWFKNNISGIIVGAVVVIIISAIAWPKQIAKLQNGEEIAVSTNIKQYSADYLYKDLKEKNGLTILLSNIDKDIINDKYGNSLDEEARKEAESQAETAIQQYKLYYQLEEDEILKQNGFNTKEEYIQELIVTYKLNKYVKEYITSNITEEDIKSYYDANVFGKKKIYLISSASDEDKVKNAQKAIKNGMSITKAKEKYKDLTYNDLEVDYDTIGSFSKTIVDAFKNLKSKETSSVVKDDTYGHVFIYVETAEDKKSYDSIKEDLKDLIATNKQTEDNTLYYKALKQLREDYGIKFNDADYKKYYDNFNKQYGA